MNETMGEDAARIEELRRENEELRRHLEEAEETFRAIREGQVDAFVVTQSDRDSVFTLESADRPYRLFVESMQQGAVTTDAAGTILFCNGYFAELLKVPPERLTGQSFSQFVADEDRATFDSLLPSGRGELALLRANGTSVPVVLGVHSLAEDEQTQTLCVLVTDLTEQKNFEALRRAQAALQKSEEELRQIAARLSEADRRKDEFLATLAHELRNPLAPIRTGLELMRLSKDFPLEMEEIRATMERQTQQIVALIDDLLDVSRITQGKLQLRKCRVKLAEVVRSALEAAKPVMQEAEHDLTVEIPDEPLFLQADPHRLAQVISNLLNNAAKYTKDGGRIWLTAKRQDDEVKVSVRDTGIGIPAEMRERIFDLFAQIDRPLEKGYTGLGIGLTLVKSLVEMHGGRIDVRSEGPNQGSEFRVSLPLQTAAADEKRDTPSQSDDAESTKRRVLVVDDNQAAADLLGMVVKMLGHEIRTAGDGREAIEVAAEFQPDVVLMDLGMPKMNGYEAAQHIRQQVWGQKMMLVALTGWGQDEDRQRTKSAGFDHHLVKPAEPAALQMLFATQAAKADAE